MKKPSTRHPALRTILALLATALPVALSAAIPQRWTVETSRVQPAQFEAYHGETIEFAAAMQTYGKPLAITNDLIGIYWQTNGMGSAYWTAPAVLSNNVMIARWTPEMDVGANVYSCFIGAPGEIYRAAFQLRLRPSPGAVPAELPLPVKTLDFAQVQVLNPPYYTRGETDARIIELAPAPGNYATVSNRAMTALQSYTETDPTVADWAKSAAKPNYSWAEIDDKPGLITTNGASVVDFQTWKLRGRTDDIVAEGDILYWKNMLPSVPSVGYWYFNGAAGSADSINWTRVYGRPTTLSGYGITDAKILNGTITLGSQSITPLTSYTETDPTVDGKISTHNSSSSAHADIRNTVNNLADNVSTWSSFWSGDDVRVTVTNYDSAVNLPSLYLEYKLSNGLFRTVWDERTRWNANELRMAALESAIEGKADRAWGYYDSHTGGWAPDGYTWLSSPKIAISGGLAYQKHVTSEGAVWVLESNGLIAESGGVMSNGFFRISDDEGNPLFEIVKGDKRTVGATAGSCEPLAGYAITHLQIGYAVESADHPKIYVTRSLTPVDWKDEEDADCPATVSWSGSSGNWTAVVAGKVAEAQLFVKAEYEVGGNTYIKQSAPVSVQKLVLGGNEYRVGTATISGHTVLTLTLEP